MFEGMQMRNHKYLKTRERVVRYSMSDFIKAVHSRPQLWERRHPDYHNRDKREQAWHVVATCLYNKFDAMTAADKRKTVVMLTKRWKNTRDGFFRRQRRYRMHKSGNDPAKPYIYEKEMSFLLNNDRLYYYNEAPSTDDNQVEDQRTTETHPTAATSAPLTNTTTTLAAVTAASSERNLHDDPLKVETIDDDDLDEDDDDDNTTIDDVSNVAVDSKSPSTRRGKRRLIEKPIVRAKRSQVISIESDLSEPDDIVEISKTMPNESNNLENREHHNEIKCSTLAPEKCAAMQIPQKSSERTTTTSLPDRCVNEASNNAESSDPDQCFFDSIKPVIRNMSMDQKLDFQIEVLKLLKDFRGRQ